MIVLGTEIDINGMVQHHKWEKVHQISILGQKKLPAVDDSIDFKDGWRSQ